MFDKVTITYRGAKYEIGRGRDFYGIWMTGAPRSQPLEWWPETPEGWSAAWTRFASIEAPGAIVPVGRRTPPVGLSAAQVGENPGPFGQNTAPLGETAEPTGETIVAAGGSTAPYGQFVGPLGQNTARTVPVGVSSAISGRTGAIAAAALLALGVILGVAGLFPAYLGGSSLAQQADQLIPHVIYLAVWTASAALILLGGARLRLGALLSLGLSVVTFGLFFADAGTAIAGGGNTVGAGLVLSLVGWLACAAGSVAAFLHRPAARQSRLGQPGRQGSLARPRGAELGPVVMLVLAGLGVAAAFAPAWDSFTLRTAAGQSQSLTAGNAFSNPGLVIAGDVAVMLALAAVVIAAALWRPVRHGAVLLAGAVIPMAAQAISALVQAGGGASPAQFGISPAQASQIGLTISSGLTPAFWIYCGFLVALAVSCAWMLFTPHPASGPARRPHMTPTPGLPRRTTTSPTRSRTTRSRTTKRRDGDAVTPDFETAPSRTAAAGDGDSSAA